MANKKQTEEQRAADRRRLERIKVSKQIAEDPRCVAHDVDELERELPLRELASLICGRGTLSDWLLEQGLRRFERQCGDPDDPFETRELMHFYANDRLQHALLGLMKREGMAGCRAVGPLYTRLGRDQIVHGRELGQRRRERLAQAAAAGNALTQRAEDDDERADLAAARRPAQPELRQREEIKEERRAREALSREEQEGRKREDRAMREEEARPEEEVIAEFRKEFDSDATAIALRQPVEEPAKFRPPERPESQPAPPEASHGLDASPAEQSPIDRVERPLAQDQPRREALKGQPGVAAEECLDG